MSREIKFRAWDSDDREMIVFDEANYSGEGYEKLGQFFSDMFGCRMLQYTGLRDKNGVEIFEGDVLRFFFDAEEYFTAPVSWIDDQIGVWGSALTLNQIIPEDIGVQGAEYEVIGNIHENPELLE